jgi:hypothetical protein
VIVITYQKEGLILKNAIDTDLVLRVDNRDEKSIEYKLTALLVLSQIKLLACVAITTIFSRVPNLRLDVRVLRKDDRSDGVEPEHCD